MKIQRVPIWFDEQGFIMANQGLQEKRDAFANMVTSARKFIGLPNSDFKVFRAEPLKYFEQQILNTYEGLNVMRLSYKKLIDLIDLDVQEFVDAVTRYHRIQIDELIDIEREHYTRYAETKEQIEKYNLLKNICDILNKAKETICQNAYLSQVQAAFGGALRIDTSFTKLYPNPDFILA